MNLNDYSALIALCKNPSTAREEFFKRFREVSLKIEDVSRLLIDKDFYPLFERVGEESHFYKQVIATVCGQCVSEHGALVNILSQKEGGSVIPNISIMREFVNEGVASYISEVADLGSRVAYLRALKSCEIVIPESGKINLAAFVMTHDTDQMIMKSMDYETFCDIFPAAEELEVYGESVNLNSVYLQNLGTDFTPSYGSGTSGAGSASAPAAEGSSFGEGGASGSADDLVLEAMSNHSHGYGINDIAAAQGLPVYNDLFVLGDSIRDTDEDPAYK